MRRGRRQAGAVSSCSYSRFHPGLNPLLVRHLPLFRARALGEVRRFALPNFAERDDASIRLAEMLEWTFTHPRLAHLSDRVLNDHLIRTIENVWVVEAAITAKY